MLLLQADFSVAKPVKLWSATHTSRRARPRRRASSAPSGASPGRTGRATSARTLRSRRTCRGTMCGLAATLDASLCTTTGTTRTGTPSACPAPASAAAPCPAPTTTTWRGSARTRAATCCSARRAWTGKRKRKTEWQGLAEGEVAPQICIRSPTTPS